MFDIVTAFWHRLDVPGKDAALVCRTDNGFELYGQAVFLDLRGPAALRYVLDLKDNWSTRTGYISGFIGDEKIETHIRRDVDGWTLNGQPFGMEDVLDLDLGFTPSTNMVQLKRAALPIGAAISFDVAWLDAGDRGLIRLPQEYMRESEFDYQYNSPTAKYQATIRLSPSGFAEDYPGLWKLEEWT